MDGQLEVEDGLRGEPGRRLGPDMFQTHHNRPEGFPEAPQLVLRLGRPGGIVVDDADGRVEALAERPMAPEPASV